MKRVLVTGAAGQVGSRLVRQLLRRNYEVRALVLPEDPLRHRLDGLEVEIQEGNLLDLTVAERAVEGVDAVIHTANFVSGTPEAFHNNILSTFNLTLAASKRADHLERFVHISSSAVYPNDSHILAPCYHPVDELHPKRPVGVYAASKWAGEEVVWSLARASGLRVSVVRPSGIYSEARILRAWTVGFVAQILRTGQSHPQSELYMADGTELWHDLERAAPPETLCDIQDMEGRPWMYQPVDARDVALGCICALEAPAAVGEAFNLSAPRIISYHEAVSFIAEQTGQPVLHWRVPVRWVFDLDISKAKSLIGYCPQWGMERMVRSAWLFQREGREPENPEEVD